MDPEDAIWDALNDDRRHAAPNDHERNDHNTTANRNTNNHNDFAALPFGGPLIVPQPEEGEDPNELLAAVARMHLADIEALREAGAGEDALLALDLFGDELRRALEMVEDRDVAARVQDENGARENEDRRQGEERRDEPAQPPRAEGPEPTLASLIRRIPGAWALPLPLGGGAQNQAHEDGPRNDGGRPPGEDAHPAEHQDAIAGGAGPHEHNHDHEHDDQVWNPGWLLSAARQWMLGNGTPPTDHDPDIPPECVVCQDVIAPGELIRAPCGHTYDVHCMNTVFMNAARDEALFPPRCCKTTIPTDLVRGRIPTTTLATFSARAAEFATPKRLYCAAPTCSAFLGARYTGWFFAKAILCPGCGAKTCSRCAHKVDPNERHRCSPAEDENQIAAVAAQEEWARCPDCEAFVELVIGCNHMTCRCGAEFCYVCSRRWKTCGCPWWDEDRLLAVREERHERRRRRRRERREREAREQAAADEDEEDVADGPAQEVADVAPAPDAPQAAAPPPPPPEDAPGPDADALPPPALLVEEVPVQPPAAPGPLMQALVGPPPGEGGAVFMRPSLRTRRTMDAAPPEENAVADVEPVPAPASEPAPPPQVAAPPSLEIAPAVAPSIPAEPPAEPLVAALVPEVAAPAVEIIPQESEDIRTRPAEEPQAASAKVSRRKSKGSMRRTPVEPTTPTANPSGSAPAEETTAAEGLAPSLWQLRNEEPIPVPAPASQDAHPSSATQEESTPADDAAAPRPHRHRSHSRSHRSSHHASRSGSRATRVYRFVPPEAQEVDAAADAPVEVALAHTDVAGPDTPANDVADEEQLDPAQEAHVRQVLEEILPPPVYSRNRRPSQAPVPPSPSPAPPELPREQPLSSAKVFYTPPAHSRDLRAPAASSSKVQVYAAPPMEKRTSSSRSSKSGSSQSTRKASSRVRKDSVSHMTSDPSTRSTAGASRHAEEDQARGPRSAAQPSISKSAPVVEPAVSRSRPRSASHQEHKPAMPAPVPTHGKALSSASALDSYASSSSLARPATQPPLASSPSRQTLRRSESLQRETRARRETREHWERVHATASASTSQQQVEAQGVEGTSAVEPLASQLKEEQAEELTRRGRDNVKAHRQSKHGKGRTVTYMTFEAAQYGSVPAEWTNDTTAPASSVDVKGKRRATEPLTETASEMTRIRSPMPNVPPSPIPRSNPQYQWDPPPKPVYRLHARLRAPVDPLAYASRLMRKTAGARRTLQHVSPPKDRPPLMLPKERDKLRVYQRPPPVVYAQTTMQHALLPTKGPVPPEAKPVLSRQSSSARIERPSTASAARPSHLLDDHKARTPHQADSQRSAGRASSSHSTPHASSPPIHSPRSTVSPRTDHHVRPPSSHHPRSARTASPRIDDVPLHQIYSRFAPVSTLHPSSPQPSHRFAPVSTLHPPIPPPPPEAAPVYACPSSRQVVECALPPEGPPVQARTGRHSHSSRRESDPLDFSTMVSRVPASESLYIHSTEFKRALKKWDNCPHDLWAYGFGPGQCLGCRRLLEDTVYRCESCRAIACADCMHDKF